MLVLAANFLLLFVFWEGVGLCSYLLIGFWYQKPSAAAAAKKAFVVNRIGDFGFLIGIFLIWTTFRSLDFATCARASGADRADWRRRNPGRITLICLLLFLGAMGKSAQFPLHVWLPDAMEGPTPVSALIHAATMVTAGVYMVARCTPLFVHAPTAQMVVSGIGAVTALLAALIALTQNDLKRVLAYSTVSQLGYMFMALGAGGGRGRKSATLAVTAGMFHLFTHAFLQGAVVPGGRQRDALDGRRDRHAAVQRPAARAADHALDVPVRCRGAGRRAAALRLLEQGRNPRGAVHGVAHTGTRRHVTIRDPGHRRVHGVRSPRSTRSARTS